VVTPDPAYPSAAAMIAALRPIEPVYCLYPAVFRTVTERFLNRFPGRVLYAVKANPEPRVLRQLHAAGVRHFDTASVPEMALVHSLFPDARCYFMAPVKLQGAMRTAYAEHGVRHCVVDHAEELHRVLAEVPAGGMTFFVRMAARDLAATYDLSAKFGAADEDVVALLRAVAEAGAEPALAFNVGSLVREPAAYSRALARAAAILQQARVNVRWLDVGGGFPCAYPAPQSPPLEQFLAAIETMRASLPLPADLQLMAEPGRALVAEGMSLVVQVLHRDRDRLYLNDGVWGSLIEPVLSKGLLRWPTRAYRGGTEMNGSERPFTLFGPTCDSLDVLPAPFPLPDAIAAGDWIEFGMIGAYSLTNRTGFNGFYPDTFVEINGAGSLPPAERCRS
jgi:ornithine decarboxylase